MKAIFLIALIACATAGPTFLGNFRKNFEAATEQFAKQYEAQLKLEQQAQDLSAAAAAGKADPQAVVDTVNGLTEAAKFWGSFVGNEVFNKEELNEKLANLKDKRAQLSKYASEDGTAAMVSLNQAIWDINVAIKSIQSLAIQLKKGSKNVQMITAIAFKNDQDMLEGRDKSIYEAAIRVLVNTLKSANNNAAVIQDKLYTLSQQLITIETQMNAISKRLKETAKGKSKEFREWRDDMRAKVYGGCAASILLGPAVFACYGIAAGVLESEIAQYKRETEAFVSEFNSWSETFTGLSTMAKQASTVSKTWYSKVVDFKNVIQNQYDLITGTEDILWMSHDLRQMISESLEELIVECDKVITDTTGRLEDVDTQQLNQEFNTVPQTDDSTEATSSEDEIQVSEVNIQAQVQAICKAANPTDEQGMIRCVTMTIKKLSTM